MREYITTALTEAAFVPLSWFLLLTDAERAFIRTKLNTLRAKLLP